MLMVVFGAGASYDSAPSHRPTPTRSRLDESRPPLADELFDLRGYFENAASEFPECQPIIPYLRGRPEGTSVEQVLQRLHHEAEADSVIYRQLAAIRYYLHRVISESERHWNDVAKGVTNYKTLLDQLRKWVKAEGRICLVTFNYDTMLEAVLPDVGITIEGLSDYIADKNYKLIKLHGSVNWAREVDTPIEVAQREDADVVRELIARSAELSISQRYRIHTKYPIAKWDQAALFPALAIPVERKKDYECPPEHFATLVACVPEVTRLLVIGWRAMEFSFLQLLVDNLPRKMHTMVVAGSSDGAVEITRRLERAGIVGQFFASAGGFTEFVVNREADEFLKI